MVLRKNLPNSLHPGLTAGVKTPSSQSSSSQSQASSYAVLTPPISSSPVSTTLSRNSSSPKVALSESFHFPESYVDRQHCFHGGKKELDKISALLLPGDAQRENSTLLRFFPISGVGGVGKTELVHKYIAEHHAKYDVVLFIKAEETNRLSQQFEKLALELGLLAGIGSTLELQNLPVEEAGNVLKYYAGFDEDDTTEIQKAAQEVAGRLDGLPLAIVQVGSNIKECRSSITGFSRAHPRESHLY
ncbi:MAG: hypothetical protein Q9191_007248, partial [Dirinaria sp. TL-2023a]